MCKLLMIDDNQLEHFIVDKMIHLYGYPAEINHYEDALSVINFLSKNKKNNSELPDLIFLDLNFPGYSGWQFLERVKKIGLLSYKKIKIYILTSSISKNDINRCKKYPFIASYIVKPITKDVLETIFADPELN